MKIRVPAKHEKPSGKVMIGYPVGGSVTLPFHVSLLKMLGYELVKGDSRILSHIEHTQGLYVADNRTLLIQRFMSRDDVDWLLQLDTDIEFPPTLLESMLEMAGEDKKILAASVPLGSGIPTCAFKQTPVPGVFHRMEKVDGVVECDAVATAVFLCHRQVFMDMADQNGQSWMHHMYLPLSQEFTEPRYFQYRGIGEDLAFGIRAKAAGHRIWCGYIPGLRHHKTQALSHDSEHVLTYSSDPGVGELVEETA